jgi:hypothetical protein
MQMKWSEPSAQWRVSNEQARLRKVIRVIDDPAQSVAPAQTQYLRLHRFLDVERRAFDGNENPMGEYAQTIARIPGHLDRCSDFESIEIAGEHADEADRLREHLARRTVPRLRTNPQFNKDTPPDAPAKPSTVFAPRLM